MVDGWDGLQILVLRRLSSRRSTKQQVVPPKSEVLLQTWPTIMLGALGLALPILKEIRTAMSKNTSILWLLSLLPLAFRPISLLILVSYISRIV
jgi:hypothetical protein